MATPLILRPLEFMQPEPELLGRTGTNRAPAQNRQTEAETDVEALESFLAEFKNSAGTLRIYRRECERFFLWSWYERGKPVSSLVREDFETYISFLSNPQPAELWCGPKSGRESATWRPFVGPMDLAAVKTSLSALNSMMGWFVDAGYLAGNPLGLIRQRLKNRQDAASSAVAMRQVDEHAKVERFLDEEMWAAVNKAVEEMPRGTPQAQAEYERLRFICSTLYLLAPRAGELETQRMNSFRESRGLWWWYVLGKGSKYAKIPVPDDMMEALVRYREFLGLTSVPSPDDLTPLLVSVRARAETTIDGEPPQYRGVTARRLNQVLKDLFYRASLLLPPRASHKRDKLRDASAHWGRHTSITAKVDAGMDRRYVQLDARHADGRTTDLYTHEDDNKWHAETQKLRLQWREAGAA